MSVGEEGRALQGEALNNQFFEIDRELWRGGNLGNGNYGEDNILNKGGDINLPSIEENVVDLTKEFVIEAHDGGYAMTYHKIFSGAPNNIPSRTEAASKPMQKLASWKRSIKSDAEGSSPIRVLSSQKRSSTELDLGDLPLTKKKGDILF